MEIEKNVPEKENSEIPRLIKIENFNENVSKLEIEWKTKEYQGFLCKENSVDKIKPRMYVIL